VQFNVREHRYVDYGYAVTSHRSQGATADRVLVHVDTEQACEQPIDSRVAYVSVSRGRYDAQVYTNHTARLGEELGRDVSKLSALEAHHATGAKDHGHVIEDAIHQPVSDPHQDRQACGMQH